MTGDAAARGALAGGGARRARAAAAGRQQHRAAWTRRSRARRAPQHRGPALQPVSRTAAGALVELPADFARLNRRMHNKSFTADNQATIVGGRNVGDEYFGAGDGVSLPTWTCSPSARWCRTVSAAFDAYWNSASAYPASIIIAADRDAAQFAAGAKSTTAPTPRAYVDAVARHAAGRDARSTRRAAVRMGDRAQSSSDDPDKVLTPPSEPTCTCCRSSMAALGDAGARARPRVALFRARRRRAPRRCVALADAA